MKNSEYMEYSSKLGFVESAINLLINSGADVLEFQEELDTIKDFVERTVYNAKSNTSLGADEKNSLINKSYCDATLELENLIIKINQFSLYFQSFTKFNSVFNAQNLYDIDSNNLSDITNELIETLDKIKSMTLENENKSLEAFYSIVYDVIKTEYRLRGTSKLLEHCKVDNVDSAYINKLVMEDIDILKYESKDFSEIEKKISKLNFADGERMYLDNNLVWLVSIGGDKEKFTEHLALQIERLTSELVNNNNSGYNLAIPADCLNSELIPIKKDAKDMSKKMVFGKILCVLPLVLTISQIGFNTARVISYANDPVYMTTTETYSSDTGETKVENAYDDRLENESDKEVDSLVKLTIYEPWKNKTESRYIRLVETTEISVEEFEQLKNLSTINVNDLNYEFTTDEEKTSKLNLDEIYEQPKFVMTKETQDVSSEKTRIKSGDSEQFESIKTEAYIKIIMYFVQIWFINKVLGATFGIRRSIKFIKESFKELKEIKDESDSKIRDIVEELEPLCNELDEILNKNRANKDKYDEIMSLEESLQLLEKSNKGMDIINKYLKQYERSIKLEMKSKSISEAQ